MRRERDRDKERAQALEALSRAKAREERLRQEGKLVYTSYGRMLIEGTAHRVAHRVEGLREQDESWERSKGASRRERERQKEYERKKRTYKPKRVENAFIKGCRPLEDPKSQQESLGHIDLDCSRERLSSLEPIDVRGEAMVTTRAIDKAIGVTWGHAAIRAKALGMQIKSVTYRGKLSFVSEADAKVLVELLKSRKRRKRTAR